jgi:DHA1 family purine ribonucleoside efflux pump-like MFS transporter
MSKSLGISEGLAGQSLTATAFAAMATSLLIGRIAAELDRRRVFLGFTVLMIVSNACVAFAPDFVWLLAARLILGVALGGFWTMAASAAMRLVPERSVPRALSIGFGGVSVSMVISAPAGTILGEFVGWRGVFVLAACGYAWLWLVLPPFQHSSRNARPAFSTSPGAGT